MAEREQRGAAAQPAHAAQVAAALQAGLRHHEAGELAQAEEYYQQALALDPDDANALHFLGLSRSQQGRHHEAVPLLNRAVALQPGHAPAHSNLGWALFGIGRHEEAIASCRTALALRPGMAEAHNNLGNALAALGRHEEAVTAYREAVASRPGYAEAHNNLGNTLAFLERYEPALASCRQALALKPDYFEAHNNLGNALHALGRYEEAVASFRQALALRPQSAAVPNHLANTLSALGRHAEAMEILQKALATNPRNAALCNTLGALLATREEYHEAITCYRRALALNPEYAEAHDNLGNALFDQGDVAGAIASYRAALALQPNAPETHKNLANALGEQGEVAGAIASFREALRIAPGYEAAEFELAHTLLFAGELAEGWLKHEWRFRHRKNDPSRSFRPFSAPEWRGEPLAGKHILVWGEQGVGDEITFAGLFPEVIQAAARCVIECAPKLVALFARAFPAATVVARTDPPHPLTGSSIDYQAPAGDLPRWLRPTLAHFPQHAGYLNAPPARLAYWRERLHALGTGPRIGFSWRSSNLKGRRALACTTLDDWGPIFAMTNVHFVCLQYDECTEELAHACARFGIPLHSFPEVDLFNDLEEAAALTRAVDLVISAPTTACLLAAALGVPTWQMSYGPDPQRLGTERNPWYPAMTHFTRAWNQDWASIIDGVAAHLREYAASSARNRSDG